MSFLSVEQAATSAPVELYLFAQADQAWRYTTFNEDVTRLSSDFRAALLGRSEFSISEEGELAAVKVQLANDLPLAVRLRTDGIMSSRGHLMMQLILTHDGDTNLFFPFTGRVTTFQEHEMYVEVNVDSARAMFKRRLLPVSGQVQCNHDFCGPGCAYNKELVKHPTSIVSVNGRDIVIADTFADELLAGGWIEVGQDKWFIEHNTGPNLLLLSKMPASYASLGCNVYDGCDHSYGMCRDKYANTRRYGGFPLFPESNPFTTRYAKERRTG